MFLVCESRYNNSFYEKEKPKPKNILPATYSEYNLISKTTKVTSNSLLIIFSSEISNPLGINLNLLFNIKRYSKDSYSQDIGSTYTFSSRDKNISKTFSFQFLDKDLTPNNNYTYSISVSSNTYISPGLIIPVLNLSFIQSD